MMCAVLLYFDLRKNTAFIFSGYAFEFMKNYGTLAAYALNYVVNDEF